MEKKGIMEKTTDYSFSNTFKTSGLLFIITTIVCSLLFLVTKNTELSVSVFVVLMACLVGGLVRSLVTEYQIKRKQEKSNKV